MKKYFYILAALSIAPTFAHAQGLDSDVDTELDQVSAPQASARSSSQPIYILNQATPTATSGSVATQNQGNEQTAVQKQPVTVVQATPLNESRAEQIRKARQDAEVQTEQKIVEKLEVSRMDDEKKRANVLFGDKFQQLQEGNGQNVQQVQVQAAPAPVIQQPVYVAPAPVQVQEVKEDHTRDMVREEIRAAMKSEDEAKDVPLESRYFGAVVGIGDYPAVSNVKGNYTLGAQFGTKYDQFIIEGTFLYSNYSVGTGSSSYGGYSSYAYNGYGYIPNTVDVNQYSGSLAAKYELFGGFIRPNVGGLIAYSYRTFAWQNNASNGYSPSYGAAGGTSASSHAIDVGVVGGADLVFTPKFALGLDFRYMFNMASRVDSNNSYWMTSPQYGTPIEKLQYYVMSVVGKVTF